MLFHSSFSSPFLADRIGGDVPYEQVGAIAEELGDKRLSAICSKNSLNIPASELGTAVEQPNQCKPKTMLTFR